MNRRSVYVNQIKVYGIQSIIRIMINIDANLKNWMIGVLFKMIICAIAARMILNIIRQVNLMSI